MVANTLAGNGVDPLFGLMGDANMQYVSGFQRDHAGRFVSAVSEGGAVLMADGYARMHGGSRPGVVSITHGPAVTNTVTALTEAARARTPLVLLTGDTPPVRHHIQYVDIKAVVTPTGAEYRRGPPPPPGAAR